MDNQKIQTAERIKQANNILVTVSNNPSVDQLAACIGLTLALNKMGKHATAVFSGTVPSALEFLQPEKTIEKSTDSLRDFIIALDKSKADKLRYKVEDRVVKIFITPYRTSISDKDLEFSQGDFNVDVVVALGVHNQADLDMAITSHGRILHDATIMTVNIQPGGELGSLNWLDPNASSLCELGVQLADTLDKKLIDGQIATAFLTGIVSETERFSNSKTSPQTMSISAELMGAGANQQLVATKLEEPPVAPPAPIATQGEPVGQQEPLPPAKKPEDGTLEIAHEGDQPSDMSQSEPPVRSEPELPPAPEEVLNPLPEPAPQIHIDDQGSLSPVTSDEDLLPPIKKEETPVISHHNGPPKMILQPPTFGSSLTANSSSTDEEEGPGLPGMQTEEAPMPPQTEAPESSSADSAAATSPDEERNAPGTSFLGDQPIEESAKPENKKTPGPNETLSDIEKDVHSSHLTDASPAAAPDQPAAPLSPPPASTLNPFAPPADDTILPPVQNSASGGLPSLPAAETPEETSSIPNMPTQPAPQSPDAIAAGTATGDTDVHPTIDSARNAVDQAMQSGEPSIEPIEGLNAQPLTTSPLNSGEPQRQPSALPAPAVDAASDAFTIPPLPSTPVQPWTPPASESQPEAAMISPPVLQPQGAGIGVPAPTSGFGAPPEAPGNAGTPPPVPPPMLPPLPPTQ